MKLKDGIVPKTLTFGGKTYHSLIPRVNKQIADDDAQHIRSATKRLGYPSAVRIVKLNNFYWLYSTATVEQISTVERMLAAEKRDLRWAKVSRVVANATRFPR